MKIKIRLERRSGGAPSDLVLTVDHAATVGDIARELERLDPVNTSRITDSVTLAAGPIGANPATLDPERQIGEADVASGWSLTVIPSHRPSQASDAVVAVDILTGPRAGDTVTLPLGTAVIGRDPGCDVVLEDSYVSKQHARLEIDSDLRLVDLNSANGLVVDGGVVTRLTVQPGQAVMLGDTEIAVRWLRTAAAPRSADSRGLKIESGAIPFVRSPRVEARFPEQELPRPKVPSEPDHQAFPWLMLIAPMLMGAAMYSVTRSPLSLMFVVMGPMMVSANFVMSRGQNKRRMETDIARFDQQLERLETSLRESRPREREVRVAEIPAVHDVFDAARTTSTMVWTRRPEHWSALHVRLGCAVLPSRVTVARSAETDDGLPEYTEKLENLVALYSRIDGVPVVESLTTAGGIGVVGPPTSAVDAARGILVQLAGLHSPSELVIAALVGTGDVAAYDWLTWLPHTSSAQSPLLGPHLCDSASTAGDLLTELEALIDTRTGGGADSPQRGPLASVPTATTAGGRVGEQASGERSGGDELPYPAVVVLISDDAPVDKARLVRLAERGADAGVFPLWVAGGSADLPAACRTFMDTGAGLHDSTVHFVRHGAIIRHCEVEGVSVDNALAFSLALAPLTDVGAISEDVTDIPTTVPLVTLLGPEFAEAASSVIDRWQQNDSVHDRRGLIVPRGKPGTLRALVGSSGADALHLDLRAQGPHALVGGTTGAGKSEFLQSWVLGMAAESSPDRVTFLFVDYKGGAAFAECVQLPHCVGLVTDLSPHLVRRALTSLRAEIHHREKLLNSKNAKDLLELEKRGDPESPPSLILVIDEFAALANEVPEFVDGVVDIAQRGRSLGIHLIMATQRPAGVIKDNLRANTNLRVALRMADEADSSDVVGSSEAAAISPSIPGRGVVKTGPGRLQPFQSAYAGGHTAAEPPRPSISINTLNFGAARAWERPLKEMSSPPPSGPSDLERLVRTIGHAAAGAEIPAPRRPWLDELSRNYELARLPAPRSDDELILGLSDHPERQSQEVATFLPDKHGNLAIYGTGGSGKSVVLRTLAAGSGVTPKGGPVHVYALDFASGGLRMIERLPHVGAVIPGDDADRVARLLRQLRDLVEERSRTFPEFDAGSIADYRAAANKPDEPRILLLVDGFPAFRDQWEVGPGRAEWYSVFLTLLSEGRSLGVHIVFTADRPGSVPGSVSSSVPHRVVLRLAEEGMYASLDVPADTLTSTSAPGRALIDDRETQIAILGGSGNVADQAAAMGKLARSMERREIAPAPPIESMPEDVPVSELPDSVGGQPVIGISDLDLKPLPFEPVGTTLIAGGPQSGRSNALAAFITAIKRWDPDVYVIYFGNRRSRIPDLVDPAETFVDNAEIATRARELVDKIASVEHDRYLIVVESLNDFASAPTDMAIADLARAVKRSDHLMVAESESSSWSSSFPIYAEFKNFRRGLLLQPETMDGETILKTAIPRVSRREFPPGRGYWIAAGKAVRVQVPLVT